MYNYSLKLKRKNHEYIDYLQSENKYTSEEFNYFIKEAIQELNISEVKELMLHDIFNEIIENHNDFKMIECETFRQIEIE